MAGRHAIPRELGEHDDSYYDELPVTRDGDSYEPTCRPRHSTAVVPGQRNSTPGRSDYSFREWAELYGDSPAVVAFFGDNQFGPTSASVEVSRPVDFPRVSASRHVNREQYQHTGFEAGAL